jgi:oligopeptidase B
MKRHFQAIFLGALLAVGAGAQSAPPAAKTVAWTDSIHGYVRRDEFHWLRDRDDPDVMAYLRAENAYADSMLSSSRKLREKLYREMRKRIRDDDLSVPVKIDSFYYYDRTLKGKEYGLYCRKKGSLGAKEEVMLDENRLAEGRKYFSIDGTFISPDHKILAYLADTSGAFLYTIYFKDLAEGKLVDSISGSLGLAWAADSRTVFYEACDSTQRTDRIIRHRLGEPADSDLVVFHEKDPEYSAGISRSKSRKYLFIHTFSKTTTEAWLCPADSPATGFTLFKPRRPGIVCYLEHRGDSLYLLTNEGAENYRLLSAPIGGLQKKPWNQVIPGRPDVLLEDVRLYRDFMVVLEREHGLQKLRIISRDGATDRYLEFPEPTYSVYPWRSYEYDSSALRYTYNSMVTPPAVYDYDMKSGSCRLMKRYSVPGYKPGRYASERIYAKAPDGEMIPVSLVYRRDLRRPGGNPCMLRGYGAYGTSSNPNFSSTGLCLLDRGFIMAIAHVRGGQEMGRRWYDDGKLLKKLNTFTDFIACAEHLVSGGYTSPSRLAIGGGSAGGLLIGGVVNMRPSLFRAAVLDVPFVDMINTMLDPSIPLTTIEYQEWGDPRIKDQYEYMASYAPYENIRAQDYPAMLVTGGLNDANVPYWEPAKWVARLRKMKTDSNPLLLKIDMSSGHGGASGRFAYLRDTAYEYAFLLGVMGIYK